MSLATSRPQNVQVFQASLLCGAAVDMFDDHRPAFIADQIPGALISRVVVRTVLCR